MVSYWADVDEILSVKTCYQCYQLVLKNKYYYSILYTIYIEIIILKLEKKAILLIYVRNKVEIFTANSKHTTWGIP